MRRGLLLYGPETWGKRPDSTRFAGSFSLHTIHTKNEAWKYGTANLKNVHRWGASDCYLESQLNLSAGFHREFKFILNFTSYSENIINHSKTGLVYFLLSWQESSYYPTKLTQWLQLLQSSYPLLAGYWRTHLYTTDHKSYPQHSCTHIWVTFYGLMKILA